MRSMGGYPYPSSSGASHPPTLAQPSVPQSQPALQAHTYSPQQIYQTTESDAIYSRHMYRELGFDTTDGTAYGAVSGCALTMPDSGQFGMILPVGPTSQQQQPQQQQSVGPYHDVSPTHPPSHGGYTQTNGGHASRHYHPYPPQTYGSHNGYGGLAAR